MNIICNRKLVPFLSQCVPFQIMQIEEQEQNKTKTHCTGKEVRQIRSNCEGIAGTIRATWYLPKRSRTPLWPARCRGLRLRATSPRRSQGTARRLTARRVITGKAAVLPSPAMRSHRLPPPLWTSPQHFVRNRNAVIKNILYLSCSSKFLCGMNSSQFTLHSYAILSISNWNDQSVCELLSGAITFLIFFSGSGNYIPSFDLPEKLWYRYVCVCVFYRFLIALLKFSIT